MPSLLVLLVFKIHGVVPPKSWKSTNGLARRKMEIMAASFGFMSDDAVAEQNGVKSLFLTMSGSRKRLLRTIEEAISPEVKSKNLTLVPPL